MITLNLKQAELQHLITHHVGNKAREESLTLSSEESLLASAETIEHLLRYFFHSFKAEEFHCFTHPVRLELNDVYSMAADIFTEPETFISASQNIAKLLYEQSVHPKVQEGELCVAYFSNLSLEHEIVDGIGIFKSETNTPFLKMQNRVTGFSIHHDTGFEIKGVDKGCIIFNTQREEGYKILIVDTANKSGEAQYWKDDFLKIKPVNDGFHQTSQFLGIAKNFVTEQLEEEFEVNKADKIDLLNRSVDYFKKHKSFDKKEFEEEVFQDPGMIKSFRNFNDAYVEDHNLEIDNGFAISPQAVKKQARVFKSVLKLDKNFHIYIHGDRDLIEQGVDENGRKYYKIYFEQES